MQRQLIQWPFPQGPQWQPRGPEMFGGAEPRRGIGEATSMVLCLIFMLGPSMYCKRPVCLKMFGLVSSVNV